MGSGPFSLETPRSSTAALNTGSLLGSWQLPKGLRERGRRLERLCLCQPQLVTHEPVCGSSPAPVSLCSPPSASSPANERFRFPPHNQLGADGPAGPSGASPAHWHVCGSGTLIWQPLKPSGAQLPRMLLRLVSRYPRGHPAPLLKSWGPASSSQHRTRAPRFRTTLETPKKPEGRSQPAFSC